MAASTSRQCYFTTEQVIEQLRLQPGQQNEDLGEEFLYDDEEVSLFEGESNSDGDLAPSQVPSSERTGRGQTSGAHVPATATTSAVVSDHDSEGEQCVAVVAASVSRWRPTIQCGRGSSSTTRQRPGGRGCGRTAVPSPGLFQWELYHMVGPYCPAEWLPNFTKKTGVLVNADNFCPVDFFMFFFP